MSDLASHYFVKAGITGESCVAVVIAHTTAKVVLIFYLVFPRKLRSPGASTRKSAQRIMPDSLARGCSQRCSACQLPALFYVLSLTQGDAAQMPTIHAIFSASLHHPSNSYHPQPFVVSARRTTCALRE